MPAVSRALAPPRWAIAATIGLMMRASRSMSSVTRACADTVISRSSKRRPVASAPSRTAATALPRGPAATPDRRMTPSAISPARRRFRGPVAATWIGTPAGLGHAAGPRPGRTRHPRRAPSGGPGRPPSQLGPRAGPQPDGLDRAVADADPEREAPGRDLVQGAGETGDHAGVARDDVGHGGREIEPRGALRHGVQRQEGVAPQRLRVRDEDRVEAGVLHGDGEVRRRGHRSARRHADANA